jgi:predicted lipoprotein
VSSRVTRASPGPWRTLGICALLLGVLAVLRPWTVRPLKPIAAAFDAATFAAEAWPTILSEATSGAVDVQAARQQATASAGSATPGRKAVFVRLTGTLVAVDRHSRVGFARVRLVGSPPGEVTVQVGPVMRGTALRDATSFIHFGDFANQFDFAAVSNALNERVLRDVVGRLDLEALTGQVVALLGATTVQPGMSPDAVLDIVPIQIRPAGGAR